MKDKVLNIIDRYEKRVMSHFENFQTIEIGEQEMLRLFKEIKADIVKCYASSTDEEGCDCECHPRTGQGWVHCKKCDKSTKDDICEFCNHHITSHYGNDKTMECNYVNCDCPRFLKSTKKGCGKVYSIGSVGYVCGNINQLCDDCKSTKNEEKTA